MAPLCVLTGPPGAGKSTVAALVASLLGVSCTDTDAVIRSITGETIPALFAGRGEQGFRAVEHAAVTAALAWCDGVVALGGGAVESDRTRAALAGAPVVFLSAGPQTALRRVGTGEDRPLLAGDAETRLRELVARRRPLYASVARFTVVTDARDAAEVAASVAALVTTAGRSTASAGTRSAGRTPP
jgi:shikimate kinase